MVFGKTNHGQIGAQKNVFCHQSVDNTETCTKDRYIEKHENVQNPVPANKMSANKRRKWSGCTDVTKSKCGIRAWFSKSTTHRTPALILPTDEFSNRSLDVPLKTTPLMQQHFLEDTNDHKKQGKSSCWL
jgi:hypothetical protein